MEKLNEVAAFLDRNPGLADCVVQITYSEMYDIAEAFRDLEQRAEAAEAIVSDAKEVISLLSEREWAEHCTKTETGKLLEELITDLHDEAALAADLAELVPEKASMADYYENVRSGEIDPEEAGIAMWDACRAAILRNIEEAK